MVLLVVIIVLCVIFDFINGFHDAANSIATIVSTKVLTPFQAVVWAAVFNFVAYYIFTDFKVADTVAKTVHKDSITLLVILSGVIAAIIWNLITWWYGIPSSSSHTLIGGFAGAAVAYNGFGSIDSGSIYKTVLFIVLAPLIGMIISIIITLIFVQKSVWVKVGILAVIMLTCFFFVPFEHSKKGMFEKYALLSLGIIFICAFLYNYFKGENAYRTANMYKKLQLVSSAALSVGHGGSDAQKVMGIIAASLVTMGHYSNVGDALSHAEWIPLTCYSAIALGTMSGGWKIVKTMGTKITKVTPLEGVCAETAGAITLFTAANLGAPVSTTHTITGSIMGVGATKRLSAVRWGVTINLIWAWILTIPVSALLAMIVYHILHLFIK
ncbi:inorganic phosphate transporter [Ferruginibacter albus]|uniref:inorganic phosphate transporter n=1 Tax=Ferruginibacter albus TaxID=2875540 RepID=UPI001CC6CF88|nr:inorganic phosphate transporter [Ferruginibacter albus]UAY52360.1 inorganic phosphate transporter [Ferruginibacter albus]